MLQGLRYVRRQFPLPAVTLSQWEAASSSLTLQSTYAQSARRAHCSVLERYLPTAPGIPSRAVFVPCPHQFVMCSRAVPPAGHPVRLVDGVQSGGGSVNGRGRACRVVSLDHGTGGVVTAVTSPPLSHFPVPPEATSHRRPCSQAWSTHER